jgi:hypothetical protein
METTTPTSNDKVLCNCFNSNLFWPTRMRIVVQENTVKLKVPKREIFDRSNFPDFYAIKSSWVCDLVVRILTYYFNF